MSYNGKQGGLLHSRVIRYRGGSVHTVLRAAARCEPVYEAIRQTVGQSRWVAPDETAWRMGGYAGSRDVRPWTA